jgi:hypothetical protein
LKSRNAGAGFEPATYGFEVGFKTKTTGKDGQQKRLAILLFFPIVYKNMAKK